ncbi:hypothetical protein F7230_09585 [Corynebacterium sp. 320]|uniref:hypothetical protein n=1 Tax=Corynebacterium TaxID=1716 RepID=UPI00125CC3CC|nr:MULTISPECIES: hypothetical protein [Corynebacterium]KAB1501453.1 hypothetical protein F7230_09585 [Corynebacterium sp. 320]KAB1551420.1 hypothetical protein F7233_07890 [Corynebacterium sp. 321]KAB1551750.1 hypothetical protein F7232_06375 [Corynebacterium sp. 319]KAB3525811.1 hypothetical protein F8354_09585 [Corynebacterium sp. 250]KAB3538745.1 hypothetical protein F8390_06955 [Corynebacterium sp. 366]
MDTNVHAVDLTGIVRADNVDAALNSFRRARVMVARGLNQDSGAIVRLRQAGDHSVDMFVSSPLKCVVSIRIPGRVTGSEVFGADTVLNALSSYQPGQQALDCGFPMPLRWPGSLPPADGFQIVDIVPAQVIRQLHADMERENQGTPHGIARSLLDQDMLTITSEGDPDATSVAMSGRIIAAMGGFGTAAEPTSERLREHDEVRVSVTSSWIRVDALFGTLFTPRPGGLARVP